MREKTEVFKVISEQNRVRILMMLMQKSLCVCEITSVLDLSTATVSNHLSYLRQNGFIDAKKEGKWINYEINRKSKDPIVQNILGNLTKWFADVQIVKADLKKVSSVNRFIICNSEIKRVEG